jgi:uncharacterized protein (TIGR02466 family)
LSFFLFLDKIKFQIETQKIMRQDWFPTPIWHFQHENYQTLNKHLLKNINQEQEVDAQGINVSNIQGWHSQDSLHQKEDKEFTEIAYNLVLDVTKEMKWDLDLVSPTINNCWAISNDKNAFNILHHHPNSILSGVYYVKVPENSGNIYFYDPRSGGQMLLPPFQQVTAWTVGKITYKPTEGLFVIFPSWLWHGVEPNLLDEGRISLSFNIGTLSITKLKT